MLRINYRWLIRFVTGLLVFCWMILIGSFSGQSGSDSGNLSRSVADHLLMVRERITGENYSQAERKSKIEAMQFPIRKLAHMSEYGLLAILLMVHFGTYSFTADRMPVRMLLSWLGASLYASADELHQLFVPGRSGQLSDVCIDAAGALLGALFLGLLFVKRSKSKKRA